MKTQTIHLSDHAPASGVSNYVGGQIDYDVKQNRIRVVGIMAGSVATNSITSEGAEILQGLVHIDRQNPSEIIFGTSIYQRNQSTPQDNGIVVPLGEFTPVDFELAFPNWLGVYGEYSLPANAAAEYQVDTYVTFYYEEITTTPHRRR